MSNIATDNPFTAAEQNTLAVFAGAIIPASAEYGIPGADDADIVADILATARPYHDAVRAGLAFQDTVATAAYGVPFAELSDADRADFVERSNTNGGFDHIEWRIGPGRNGSGSLAKLRADLGRLNQVIDVRSANPPAVTALRVGQQQQHRR